MRLPFAFATRFVAGETLSQAIPKVQQLNDKNIHITLDLLGENVDDRATADGMILHYIDILKRITEVGLDATISIKTTMLGLSIDNNYCRDNLFMLLEKAKDLDQFVRIDMEGSDYTQVTIDLFKESFKQYGRHVGIVIQAYLHRSKEDIPELAEMGADIRLCKGAYNEPKRLALQNMDAIRDAYENYAKILLENTTYPRIATHDDQLINWTKKYISMCNIDKSRFEFQMLYGLRQQTMETMSNEGYNTRIYVPFWNPVVSLF